LLWIGLAIFSYNSIRRNKDCSTPVAAFISPAFTYFLLCYVSGIPLLEKNAARHWGKLDAYKDYLRRTPVLWPKLL